MTTDITELAQREKFEAWLYEKPFHARYMHWSNTLNAYDYTGIQLAWEAYQAGGTELVEALEKAQNENELARGQLLIAHRTLLNQQQSIADLVTGRQNLQQTMGVYVHAYEEAKGQVAKDVEIKARLCRESNSLFDRLRAAEKRIADLESRTVTVKQYDEFQICHYGATEDYAKGYIDCQNNFSKWLTAAGIKWEAE